MPPRLPIDWAASPTLCRLRELIGEDATRMIVATKGGQTLRLPTPDRLSPDHWLARAIGLDRARLVCAEYGGAARLDVPNGRGLAHARRVDPASVAELDRTGASANTIARELDCTERNVRLIRAKLRDAEPDRQTSLF